MIERKTETLPHSPECEQAILGGMLLDKEAADYALDELSSEDFFSDRCRITFSAMGEISRAGSPVDWLTITRKLQDNGKLEAVGGVSFLTELSDCMPSVANIGHYINVVKQKATLRRLIFAGNEIISRASRPVEDVDELLSDSLRLVNEVGGVSTKCTAIHSSSVVAGSYSAVMDAYEAGTSITGITTGFRLIDAATGGLQPKDFIVLMARPSMGKTALALTCAMNQARRGHHVGILSLEMSCDQLGMRMLSAEGKVNLKTLRRGMLSQSDWDRVTEAEARISEWPIWIDEEAGLTSGRISSKARRMHKEHGLEVLYIDHVHLVRGDRGVSSREREMALISGNLKGLAKELNIPVVALAQLNRKCEERTNKRPQLSDLRDSGALEQDADCVFGLYRDHHYNDNSDMNEAEFIINKQRNGEVGKIPLRWVPEWTTFMDAEVKRL